MPIRLRDRFRAFVRPQPVEARSEIHGVEENRRYWDSYASHWTGEWGGFELSTHDDPVEYSYLGDEWGNPLHVADILDEFVYPYLSAETVALEIGSGGGRVSARVSPKVAQLYCLDVSEGMLQQLRRVLADRDNLTGC